MRECRELRADGSRPFGPPSCFSQKVLGRSLRSTLDRHHRGIAVSPRLTSGGLSVLPASLVSLPFAWRACYYSMYREVLSCLGRNGKLGSPHEPGESFEVMLGHSGLLGRELTTKYRLGTKLGWVQWESRKFRASLPHCLIATTRQNGKSVSEVSSELGVCLGQRQLGRPHRDNMARLERGPHQLGEILRVAV
jgi:hypothetical protein